MMLSVIAAVAANGVIGRDNALPWHLPADLRRFKKLTMGHSMIMGRRTWEAIGRPLPGRRSLVLTRRPDYRADGADIAHNLDAALTMTAAENEVFIIGGATVYRLALPRCDRLYLTRLDAPSPGDTLFPAIDETHWDMIEETCIANDEQAPCPYRFQTFVRLTRYR